MLRSNLLTSATDMSQPEKLQRWPTTVETKLLRTTNLFALDQETTRRGANYSPQHGLEELEGVR